MKIAGFETSSWLYECDGKGRARRHKKSSAPGHAGWGEWGHCVFVRFTHPGDICLDHDRLTLLYAGADKKYEPFEILRNETVLPRPEGSEYARILRTNLKTGEAEPIQAYLNPVIGNLPVRFVSSDDDPGKPEWHVSPVPITRLFTSRAMLEKIIHPPVLDARPYGGLFLVPRPTDRAAPAHIGI